MNRASIVLIGCGVLLLFDTPLAAQFGPGVPTDSMGRYRSTEEKASAALSRGLRAKKRAEEEREPAKKKKLLLKAKEELSEALAYVPSFDAYLALGQVNLALGERESARDACLHARGLKPTDAAVRRCLDESTAAPAAAATPTPSAASPSDPPPAPTSPSHSSGLAAQPAERTPELRVAQRTELSSY